MSARTVPVVMLLAAALAPGPAAAGAASLGHVALLGAGVEGERASLAASLGEQLGRLGVQLLPPGSGAPEGSRLLATLSVELPEGADASLTLTDATGRLVLFRRLPRTASPAVLVETTAMAALSAVEELVLAPEKRAARVVVAPRGPAPTVAEAPPLPPEPRGVGLTLAALLSARALGGGAPMAPGAGLSAGVALHGSRWRPALTLSATLHPFFDVGSELLVLRTDLLALRLVPAAEVLAFGPFRVELGLGGGADLLRVTPLLHARTPGPLARPTLAAAGVLTAQVTGHLALSRAWGLFLALSLDVDVAPVRFVATTAGVKDELFAPDVLRPGLVLGGTWDVGAGHEEAP